MNRLQRFLKGWCVFSAVLGLSLLGGFSLAATNPVHIEATPIVTVAPCSGNACVTFALTFANVSFANGVSASSQIQVTTAGCVLIDSTGFCASKLPASWPGAIFNISYWNPTLSIGTVAILQASAPASSSVTIKLVGVNAYAQFIVTKNSAYYTTMQANSAGNATFTWFISSQGDPTIQVDVAPGSGGGGGGGTQTPIRILPLFSMTRFFLLFDASSDEFVQFHDISNISTIPKDTSPTRLWKFGDGTFSSEKEPLHRYNYSFSASFDVSLSVCVGQTCNITTQSVTMIRWHMLMFAGAILGTTLITLVLVWRYGRKR